jgi:hypothetical protein
MHSNFTQKAQSAKSDLQKNKIITGKETTEQNILHILDFQFGWNWTIFISI